MPTPNFGERTQQDFRQWSKMDGIYYEKHKTNHGEMRTWRVSFNPFQSLSNPPTIQLGNCGTNCRNESVVATNCHCTRNDATFIHKRFLLMTITLDKVTAEMLKEVMKRNRQTNAKKFLSDQIQRMYLAL